MRHILLGPSPVALVPFAILMRRGWPAPVRDIGRLPLVGFAAFVVAIGSWFVPMVVVTSGEGELLAYRNEILFDQTVTRYAGAWQHHEPFCYYLTHVILVFWLPLSALVPWLWPRWRAARETEAADAGSQSGRDGSC
jgi:4-amino-4-deoxy-L-arabinose transferase-like glycosyltransferase